MKQPQGVYKNYSYNLARIRIFSRVKLRKIADCDFLRRTAKQKKAAANFCEVCGSLAVLEKSYWKMTSPKHSGSWKVMFSRLGDQSESSGSLLAEK